MYIDKFGRPNNTPMDMMAAIEGNKRLTPARAAELDALIKQLSFGDSNRMRQMSPEEQAQLELAHIERYGQKDNTGSFLKGLGMTLGPFIAGTAMTGGFPGMPGGDVLSGSQGVTSLLGNAGADTLGAASGVAKTGLALADIAKLAGGVGSIAGMIGAGKDPQQVNGSQSGFTSLSPEVQRLMLETLLPDIKSAYARPYQGAPRRVIDSTETDPTFGSQRRLEYDRRAYGSA